MSQWQGELRFLAVDVDRVVFHRDPNDEVTLTPGRRYMVVAVEIADDETLDPHTPERTAVKRTQRNPSNVAAILSKEHDFQQWAADELVFDGKGRLPANEDTAKELIRRRCGITSRAQLDTEAEPLAIFHTQIEVPYYRHIMQIKRARDEQQLGKA